jgi:hypothetical protein
MYIVPRIFSQCMCMCNAKKTCISFFHFSIFISLKKLLLSFVGTVVWLQARHGSQSPSIDNDILLPRPPSSSPNIPVYYYPYSEPLAYITGHIHPLSPRRYHARFTTYFVARLLLLVAAPRFTIHSLTKRTARLL